jgi:hypothetical protein
MVVPSGENATLQTKSPWPSSCRSCLPVAVSHILTDLSREPDAMVVPSGENATLLTEPPWPSSCRSCLPVVVSHILTEPSCEPDAMVVPSPLRTPPFVIVFDQLNGAENYGILVSWNSSLRKRKT